MPVSTSLPKARCAAAADAPAISAAVVLVMTGVIFGANEVIAVAFATESGDTGFSSIILGAFALGFQQPGL